MECEWPRMVRGVEREGEKKKKRKERRKERKKKSCHGIWILCGRKPRGGLLAHIIDSRVAARDAPALLCPVERWQEAWFRDNSFLIACLIHTTSNYTAVPRASLLLSCSLSKSFRGRKLCPPARLPPCPPLTLSLSSPRRTIANPLFQSFSTLPLLRRARLVSFLACRIRGERRS